jgi:hypothetical protein
MPQADQPGPSAFDREDPSIPAPPSLTEAEKDRIRREEEFRREVRREFEGPTPSSTALYKSWSFLNSGVGIWMLSTVAVSVFTFSFTQWQREQARRAEDETIARRLKAEIANHFYQLDSIADYVSSDAFASTPLDPENYLQAFMGVMTGSPNHYIHIFPEYGQRSLTSLLYELEGHVPGPEKAAIHESYLRSIKLFQHSNEHIFKIESITKDQHFGSLKQYFKRVRDEKLLDSMKTAGWMLELESASPAHTNRATVTPAGRPASLRGLKSGRSP